MPILPLIHEEQRRTRTVAAQLATLRGMGMGGWSIQRRMSRRPLPVVLIWIRFGPGVGGRYAAAVELVLISGSGIARRAIV